jgi:Fur family ferric uptake transcriptional regulator
MNKEFFRKTLKKKKVRMSHPRLLIYKELSQAKGPLTAQDLYQCLIKNHKRIGLSSIYRCLDLFESIGMAFKITNGSNGRYKLCELEDHHHHIVCKSCGKVMEFDLCEISSWSEKVMESTGFKITDHQLNFYGFCEKCKFLKEE